MPILSSLGAKLLGLATHVKDLLYSSNNNEVDQLISKSSLPVRNPTVLYPQMSRVVCYCLPSQVNHILIHHLKNIFRAQGRLYRSRSSPQILSGKKTGRNDVCPPTDTMVPAICETRILKKKVANSTKFCVDSMGSNQKRSKVTCRLLKVANFHYGFQR